MNRTNFLKLPILKAGSFIMSPFMNAFIFSIEENASSASIFLSPL